MRLNHVESFYAFLLHFRSEDSEEEGRPTTASPHARLATHGQAAAKAPCKGATDYSRASLQGSPTPLARAAAYRGDACGHDQLQPASGGGSHPRAHLLAVRRPQRGRLLGARKALPPMASPVASKGGGAGCKGGCRWARAAAACAGATKVTAA
ncbi:hypothetical protein BHM03_00035300 [Ensete ventricosum]|nr:hypothetical protein BHM03_00035300 [Ensete ventricosum]